MIFEGSSKLCLIKHNQAIPLRCAVQRVSLAVIWTCVYREPGYWTAAANAINLSYPALSLALGSYIYYGHWFQNTLQSFISMYNTADT